MAPRYKCGRPQTAPLLMLRKS